MVTSISRRYATISNTATSEQVSGRVLAKFRDLCVGDAVSYAVVHSEAMIESVAARKNCFLRSSEEKSKTLAANVDHIFVVTAKPPLLNFIFIDRALTAALSQGIGVTIICNKIDLGVPQEVQNALATYEQLGVPLLMTSAKSSAGLAELHSQLDGSSWQLVLLTGVSGVGKSSLINKLIPGAQRDTKEVSEKTGQGKQTTTFTVAHTFPRRNKSPLFIADSPGLQNFGLAHLTKDQILKGFPEIAELRLGCKFSDCSHTHEAECAVVAAVDDGTVAPSRYLSYLHIMEALEREKEFRYS